MSDAAPHCLVEKRGHTSDRDDEPSRGAQCALRRDAGDHEQRLGSGRLRSRHPRRDPDRRRRLFLRRSRPQEHDDKPPGDSFKERAASTCPSILDALLKGRRLTKPLIAAVEGPAIAGGTEILQGTDIRVAGESAKFGVSEAKWGLYPLGGSAVRLVRQIPYTVAADILLTGRHITAAEALDYGLIGHVVPDGTALDKALELADQIAANGPVAVQAILQDDPRHRGHAREGRIQARRAISASRCS